MVKTKGQLLSLGASGTIGKAITYSSWKGRPYAKQFKVPIDPKAAVQLGIRDLLRYLSQQWKGLSEDDQVTWRPVARVADITPFDSYIGLNLSRYIAGKGITQAYPAAEDANTIAIAFAAPEIKERYLNLKISATYAAGGWATFIYRSDNFGFDPHPDNLVHAFTTKFLPQFVIVKDVPPYHANWYYRGASSNATGTLKTTATQWGYTW